jgi:hypothetical protein
VKCYATIKRSVFIRLHIRAYIHYYTYIQVNKLCCFRYMFILCVCELLTWINILRNPNIPLETWSSRWANFTKFSNDVKKIIEAMHNRWIWCSDGYTVDINNCNCLGFLRSFIFCLKPITHSDIWLSLSHLIPLCTLAKVARLRSLHKKMKTMKTIITYYLCLTCFPNMLCMLFLKYNFPACK